MLRFLVFLALQVTGTISWHPDVLPGEEATDTSQTWARIEQVAHEAAPEVDISALHQMPAGIIRDDGVRHAVFAELPSR